MNNIEIIIISSDIIWPLRMIIGSILISHQNILILSIFSQGHLGTLNPQLQHNKIQKIMKTSSRKTDVY